MENQTDFFDATPAMASIQINPFYS